MSPVQSLHRSSERELRATQTADLVERLRTIREPEEQRRVLDEVIVLHMPVADGVVSRYAGRGVATEDLQQVAYTALTRAAYRFDPDQGTDFVAFAVPCMRGEVRKYFRDHAWTVRPTRRIQELQPEVNGASEELWRELGRAPRPSEIAERIDEPLDLVVEALSTDGCFQPASLDQPVQSDSAGSATLGDLLGDDDLRQEQVEARVVLQPVLRRLSERDRRILEMRFMQGLTQREIAEDIGVTQMQVSRLLSRIFRDLRAGIGELDTRAATY